MKLLLIEPCGALVRPPHGLHYVASAAKARGHTVHIHDESLYRSPSDSLDCLLSVHADVYGISVYTTPRSIARAERISAAIKSMRQSATVVWGGWHPTLYGRQCIQSSILDVVVRGPGENVMCDLLTAIEERASFRNVPNILFREGATLVETPPEIVNERHLFPPLDYDIIETDRYVRGHDQGGGRLQYVTSRGCYGRCAFCASRLVDKRRRVRKPKEQCVDELRPLVKKHNVRHLVFSDPVAFANGPELEDLADIVRSVGDGKTLTWRCDARVDALSRLPNSAYETAVASGCIGFTIGVESGVDRVLDLMQKDITVEQISTVMAHLKEHRLDGNLFWFMTGFPGETAQEASTTISLACRTRMQFPRSNIVLNQYDPGLVGHTHETSGEDADPGVGRRRIAKVSYYLGASVRGKPAGRGVWAMSRRARQRCAVERVEHGYFGFPIEYYMSRCRDAVRIMLPRKRQ